MEVPTNALSTPVPSVCSNFSLPSGRTKAILHSIHSEKEGPKLEMLMQTNLAMKWWKSCGNFRLLPMNMRVFYTYEGFQRWRIPKMDGL